MARVLITTLAAILAVAAGVLLYLDFKDVHLPTLADDPPVRACTKRDAELGMCRRDDVPFPPPSRPLVVEPHAVACDAKPHTLTTNRPIVGFQVCPSVWYDLLDGCIVVQHVGPGGTNHCATDKQFPNPPSIRAIAPVSSQYTVRFIACPYKGGTAKGDPLRCE